MLFLNIYNGVDAVERAAPNCRYLLASQGTSGGPLPSNEDMGSKMPNCLRTAMKRIMTTPMANSSMPWIPMTAGQGEPAQGQVYRRRPPARGGKVKPGLPKWCWARLVNNNCFLTVVNQNVIRISPVGVWLHGLVSRSRRLHENQTSVLDEGCSNVNTDAEVENMWKPTYMENLLLWTHEGKWGMCHEPFITVH